MYKQNNMSLNEFAIYKRNRINTLTQQFNVTMSRLNLLLANNIHVVNASTRFTPNQKRQQITSLTTQHKTNVNTLRTQLNQNVAIIQAAVIPQARVVNKVKRALLIGINYKGTSNQLYGCINDVNNVQQHLLSNGFNQADIKVLTDDTSVKPTKANILAALRTLLTSGQPGDLLFLMYSGHGSYTLDRNGDESTGYDQMIMPLDLNMIVDDELKSLLVSSLKPKTTLFAMFDSCYSGSVLDLRYQYMDSLNYDQYTENAKQLDTKGDVLMVSGCNDYQTSVDAFINRQASGAMTWSLLESLKQSPKCTWREMVKNMRDLLKTSQYEQIPQLSSGTFENIDTPVFI